MLPPDRRADRKFFKLQVALSRLASLSGINEFIGGSRWYERRDGLKAIGPMYLVAGQWLKDNGIG